MAGIGKYKKGKKFQLKSGNTPSFKNIGSPLNQKTDPTNTGSDAEAITGNNDEEPKVNKTATLVGNVLGAGIGAFTSGLDAVYGSGKVIPGKKVKFHDKKDKKEDGKTGEQKVEEIIKK